MGVSLTMIDRRYGHLARDGRDHAINLLDAYSRPRRSDWQLVATGGNGLGLCERLSGLSHLPPVATGCDRSAPETLHP
jgi:hypothetical protein